MTNDINKLKKKIEKIEKREANYLNSNNKKILNRCKQEFDNYQNKNSYYYDSTNELYNYIKDKYIKKIDQGKLDIKIERIRIERCLGKHKGLSDKVDGAGLVLMTGFITYLLNLISIYLRQGIKDIVISTSVLVMVVGFFMYSFASINNKSGNYERDLVNYISLKVLDDIEKGIIK